MRPRVVIALTPADLERERPNLDRGSVIGAEVAEADEEAPTASG